MRRVPLLVVLAAWALPGLGHLLLGRRAKAAWFGSLILGTFALGLLLGQGASVSSARYPWHMCGQIGAGLVALLANGLLGSAPQRGTIDRLELGLVFTTVAGILNLVAMVDAYELARGRSPGEGSRA
ncbi:MAG TPA: DUF6677 family protein [Planctomycetota bacterium]|nr:DUF6677 family protein [Planctomycetota bacterium]